MHNQFVKSTFFENLKIEKSSLRPYIQKQIKLFKITQQVHS
jgi:hypothetical protein